MMTILAPHYLWWNIRKNLIIFISAISFFISSNFLCPWASADPITLELLVDRNQVELDDQFILQITISGSRYAPRPEIENIDAFEIQASGSTSQIRIINGQTSIEKIYQYTLFPKKEGIFTIGPARVRIKGQVYSGQPIRIKVQKGTPKKKTYYLLGSVEHSEVYVGQQILFTLRAYFRTEVELTDFEPPTFQGAWHKKLGKLKQSRVVKDGIPWDVIQWRWAIFPDHQGTLTISSGKLTANIVENVSRQDPYSSFFGGGFFGRSSRRKSVAFSSKPISVNVIALPLEGRPNKFSGLVGQVQLKTKLSKKKLKTGQSTTLTIQIRGDANMNKFLNPQLDIESIKIYDEKSKMKEHLASNGYLQMTKIIKKSLVPQMAGNMLLPPFKMNYFNPKTHQYKIIKSPSYHLEVLAGREKNNYMPPTTLNNLGEATSTRPSSFKQNIKVLGQDLMPLIKNPILSLEKNILETKIISLAMVMLIGPLLYVMAFLYQRRQLMISGDTNYLVRARAYKFFQKEQRRIKIEDSTFYAQTANTLRNYIGHKLDLEGNAIT